MSLGISRFRKLLGMERVSRPFDSEISAYERLRLRGLVPDGIIDVGAYEGAWTRAALSVWPHCPVLMVEPQAAKKQKLEAVCETNRSVSYQQCLLGAEEGHTKIFYEMETGSSIYPENTNVQRQERYIETTTLDLAAKDFVGGHIFLKIDVQGAELDVLRGASRTLARTEAIQLEMPFIAYNQGAPRFYEIINKMEQLGFSPVEISNTTILKGVFIQADIVFVCTESDLFTNRIEF